MSIPPVLGLCGPIVLVSVAAGQGLQVDVQGGYVVSIRNGSYTVTAAELCTGRSSGEVADYNGLDFPPLSADELNLNTYFVRDGVPDDDWDVTLGLWWDTNGSQPDFFLFELGGNDLPRVSPLLAHNVLGQPVTLSGWTPTGYIVPSGYNKGQEVYVLGFSITDLLGPTGQALKTTSAIAGLRFESDTIDGATFCAVDPKPDTALPLMRAPVMPVGKARVWFPFTVLVRGPWVDELSDAPNPFLDYRLQVRFAGPSGQVYDVPGFYHARGMQGSRGDIWMVRFTPDEAGDWTFTVSFRTGTDVAVSLNPQAGTPVSFVDGYTKPLTVLPRDPDAPGFLALGRLEYVGGHYLKFRDGGYFLKTGTNSPENILSYAGIDHPQNGCNVGGVHSFAPHVPDWQPGDPLFVGDATGVDSKGLVGALNYLEQHGVNSIYALLMNLGGDGNDVFPFVGSSGTAFEDTHYDVGKLEQWDVVFSHAQRKGIALHLVLGEVETQNMGWLDNGALGVERKLFYREMVARFGHHNAVKWNLSEESKFSVAQLASFADYIAAVDPYDHPICVHTLVDDFAVYGQIYGDPRYDASSMQYSKDNGGAFTEQLRAQSTAAGRPWVVDMDENGDAIVGLSGSNADDMRKRILYDVLFSGGNIEWYLGWQPLPLGGDLDLEDFSTREAAWDDAHDARLFMEAYLPFWEMQPMDGLLTGEHQSYGGGEVLAKPGQVYAIYLPKASTSGSLDLSGAPGTFVKRWFDPRTGKFAGTPTAVQGGGALPLGQPPYLFGEDWVVLLQGT